MNVFDQLFPRQTRRRGNARRNDRRVAASIGRNRLLGVPEFLENRALLAVTISPNTPSTFIIDLNGQRNADSTYAAYSIKNDGPSIADAWVKASAFTGDSVKLAPEEDGLYHIGMLNTNEPRMAYFFLTATTGQSPNSQPFKIEVFDGPPNASPAVATLNWQYDIVEDSNTVGENKIESVTLSSDSPSVGDELTMTVTGYLAKGSSNAATQVFFTPATKNNWLPDIFELRSTSAKINNTAITDPGIKELYFDSSLPTGSEQMFTVLYKFLITGTTDAPTTTSPSQYCRYNQETAGKWKTHREDYPFPIIKPVSPVLTIAKSATPSDVVAGEEGYKFTITVKNTSTIATAQNVSVVDTLPGLPGEFTPTAFTQGAVVTYPFPAAGQFTWDIGLLGPNQTVTLDVFYSVAAGVIGGTYTNKAVVKIGNEPKATTSTDVTVTTSSVLTIAKTAKEPTVIAGTGGYTYQITVKNEGPSDTQQVVSVFDTLPTGFKATAFTPSAGVLPVAPTFGPFTWTIGTMAAGETKVLDVTYEVAANVTPGTKTNNADVRLGTETKASTSTDVTVTTSSVLKIAKTAKEPTVIAGTGGYTYQITVKNEGPSDTQQVVSVFDTLPTGFKATAFTPSAGVLPVAPTFGPFTWTIGTMAAGETKVLDVTYEVAANVTPGTKTNNADVRLGTETKASTSTDVTVTTSSVLKIAKTAKEPTVIAGTGGYTYQITVTNDGPSNTQQIVSVFDTLPFGFIATAFAPEIGTVAPAPETAGPFTWTIGTMTAGETRVLSVEYRVAPDVAPGTKTNNADVRLGTETKASTSTDVTVTTAPSLTITKTASPLLVKAGEGGYKFQITVKNIGPSDAQSVSVVDTLPAGFTATAFSPSAGVLPVAPTAGPFTWTIGTLAAGATTILDITYGVASSVPESTQTNTAVVKIGEEVKGTANVSVDVEGVQPPLSIGAALVVGSDDGCNGPPWVRVIDPNSGVELSRFLAYDSRFRGSVRVATGDVTGDGIAEIITAPGRNAIGEVRVFQRNPLGANQQNGFSEWTELVQYRTLAFGPRYRGGVEVAVANVDGVLGNEIITAMSINSGMVNIFRVTPSNLPNGDPVANTPFKSFRGAPAGTNNGVMISAGDYINGGMLGGPAEIAVGTNSGTRALVRIFDVSGTPTVVRSFNPFANGFRGGVTLSTADYDGNGSLDLIVGAGLNGGSRVEVWNPATTSRIAQTSVFSSLAKPNARVFAVFGTAADGFLGPDSTFYGVQGLNGGRGSKGVWKVLFGKAESLVNSQTSLPPLRIAPIGLLRAPIAPRLR